MFCFNFLQSREELHNIMKYCRVILIRGIDGVYRLIEKIKRREENCYVAPYGRGKLKKRLLSEFLFLGYMAQNETMKSRKVFQLILCTVNTQLREITMSHNINRLDKIITFKKRF